MHPHTTECRRRGRILVWRAPGSSRRWGHARQMSAYTSVGRFRSHLSRVDFTRADQPFESFSGAMRLQNRSYPESQRDRGSVHESIAFYPHHSCTTGRETIQYGGEERERDQKAMWAVQARHGVHSAVQGASPVIPLSTTLFVMTSMHSWNACGSPRSIERSLKANPGFGKFGTIRTFSSTFAFSSSEILVLRTENEGDLVGVGYGGVWSWAVAVILPNSPVSRWDGLSCTPSVLVVS